MKRILIIEDDPAILKGLETSLQEEHYQVFSVSDGEKGYQRAKSENVDLIILDIMLPFEKWYRDLPGSVERWCSHADPDAHQQKGRNG